MTCSLCKKVGHNKRTCKKKQTQQIGVEQMKQMTTDELTVILKQNNIENDNYSKERLIFLIKKLSTKCAECNDSLNDDDMKKCLEKDNIISICAKKQCFKCFNDFCPGKLLNINKDGNRTYICEDCSLCTNCGDQITDIAQNNWLETGLVCEYCQEQKPKNKFINPKKINEFATKFPIIASTLPYYMWYMPLRVL